MAAQSKHSHANCVLLLQPDAAAGSALERTAAAFGELREWLDTNIPSGQSADLVALHREWYARARSTFPLPASMVTLGFKDWAARRRGDPADGVPYDSKLYSVRGVDAVAISTVAGRVTIPCVNRGYARAALGGVPARLVRGSDGWELWIGVDRRLPVVALAGDQTMMTESVLSRIGRVLTGAAHAAADAAEQMSPDATLEQAIREIDGAAEEIRVELGKATAERHRVVARLKELETERAEIELKVARAIESKRDDLAEAGVGRQLDVEAQSGLLSRVDADVEERIGQLESTLEAIRASRREAEARLRDLRQSRAAGGPGEAAQGRSSATARAQAKVERAQATAERVTGVMSGPRRENAAALEELDRLHREHAIKERLARIKASQTR